MPPSPLPMTHNPKARIDSQEKDRLYQKGLEAFNSSHFYEAHEHWEEVWLKTPNPEKMFLQGLIQVTAAFHHWQRNNPLGTARLLQGALRRLEAYPASFGSISVALLCNDIREWLEALEMGAAPPQAGSARIRAGS